MTETNKPTADTEEARAYFAQEAMKVARHDVARALFEHVITNIAHIAATLPAGALVRDFAAGLPTGEDARDGWWIAAFTTAVRALELPHYNASLERWQRARDFFNLGNATEREQGAAELYAWWNDDAPAMCRTVVASPVANNAVLAMLELEPEPEQPTVKRVAAPMPASVLQDLLRESWMTPGALAWWWSQENTIEPVTIVAAADWLGGEICASIKIADSELAGIPTRELRRRHPESPADTRRVLDVFEIQKRFALIAGELEETRKTLNGMRLQRDHLQDELEETRKASTLELSVMREERDTARAERDALRADLERATAPTPDVAEADE